jgi:hypothetical protein
LDLSDATRRLTRNWRRGWCLGGAKFRRRLLAMADEAPEQSGKGRHSEAAIEREHEMAEAERIVTRALEALEVDGEALAGMRKNDERKALIGALARKRTTASNGWITQRLGMGVRSRVSRYCCQARWSADAPFRRKLNRLEKTSK